MAKRKRRMVYRVKADFLGKVKLQDGNGTHLLDENTSQDVLKELHTNSELAQQYIELVTDSSVAQNSDNGKVGQ